MNFSWFASAYDTDDWIFRLTTMVQMIGVLVMRHLVQLEPIASASTDELVRHLAPAFRALLHPPTEDAPKDSA